MFTLSVPRATGSIVGKIGLLTSERFSEHVYIDQRLKKELLLGGGARSHRPLVAAAWKLSSHGADGASDASGAL